MTQLKIKMILIIKKQVVFKLNHSLNKQIFKIQIKKKL
jgi:hypothetical protein